MARSRWMILVVFTAWTLLVWATRLDNIWADETLATTGKIARTLLALSFVAVAATVGAVAVRTFRNPPVPADLRMMVAASGWTIAVWVLRSLGIATGDQGISFVAVHLTLGVISAGLALASLRVVQQAARPVGLTAA